MGSSFNFPGLGGQPTSVMVLEQQEVWVLDGRTPPKFFGQGKFTFSGEGTLLNGSPANVFNQAHTLTSIDSNMIGDRPLELRFGEVNSTPFVLVPQAEPINPLSASLKSPSNGFDYNKPANIADIAGSWGKDVSSSSFYLGSEPMTVGGAGELTAPTMSNGCSVSGTLKPRSGGKNVFNVSVTLSSCADAGDYAGIAFSYVDTGFVGNIYCLRLIAINSSKTKVFNVTTTR